MTRRVRGRRWRAAVVLGALLVAAAAESGQEAPGRRLALVVGNDAYRAQGALVNAVNDARAVTNALTEVGFSVTKLEDATRARLTSALGDFARSLRDDDIALFYFAGHGVQVEQENYLLPTDYVGQTATALRLDAIRALDVQEMLRPARVAMLVFDACRNNPYRGTRSGGAGLAPMEARGTLIAYAAGAGEEAADVPEATNGLFTGKFVEALRVPGLTATDLFRRVRREVYQASNAEQWPAVYDDLLSDFMFRSPVSARAGAEAVSRPAAVADTAAATARLQQETVFWESIQGGRNPADFEAFLEQFPNGTFAGLARNRLAALGAPAAERRAPDPPRADPRQTRRRRAGEVFRDCDGCPEMVVQSGGALALGRYEVTVGEYLAFASVAGAGAAGDCGGGSWRDPGFAQTERHPVTCVSWHDAQAYASWLSRRTGAAYRLPTAAEWERAAAGSGPGCHEGVTGRSGTCPVGFYGANAAGLSDMVGNLYEWTADCAAGDCGQRMLRGGSWGDYAAILRPGARSPYRAGFRAPLVGFRVATTLD